MKGLACLFVCLVLVAQPLPAEEKRPNLDGRLGITIPNTGVIWHVSDRFAVLPSVAYSHTWFDYSSWNGLVNNPTPSSASLTFGTELRLYLREWNGVRVYLSPKYSLRRASSVATSGLSSTVYYHSATGAWGLQYSLNGRVSIFGDIGAGVSWWESNAYSTKTLSTSASWGLILYLNRPPQ